MINVIHLFSKKLTDSLLHEFKNNKTIENQYTFLDLIRITIVEPLLTTSTSKGNVSFNIQPFYGEDDIRLLSLLGLTDWVQNKW